MIARRLGVNMQFKSGRAQTDRRLGLDEATCQEPGANRRKHSRTQFHRGQQRAEARVFYGCH